MSPNLVTATEAELRDAEVPSPKTLGELSEVVRDLTERKHDYGTCCYAMSIAATAAFNYVADKLGVTGFQSSCADLDILRRTRGLKNGFRIINFEKLLYPQYDRHLTVTPESLLSDPRTRKTVREQAAKLLTDSDHAHPDVVAHWRKLASLPVLEGEVKS